MAAKKKTAKKKTATKKKAAVKKKATVKKKAASKKAAKKKTAKKKAVKKKAAGKKKAPATKKKTTKKKVAGKKKAPATKKKTATKKAEKTKKKAAAKSAPTKEKTAPKKKAATAKKKVVSKNSSNKAITRKKPSGTDSEVKNFTPYQEKVGEDYMNAPQEQHFRELLQEWKRTLMEEVDRTVHHMQDEASNFPDPNDRATQEEEFALELRTRDRERKLIKKIDEAILSLDTGDYGYCEVCGVEIGIKRLEARPTATLCIDCKTLAEIKERQLG